MSERWLLVYNCQAMGLANCLTLLSDRLSVEYFDHLSIQEHRQAVLARLGEYDRIIVLAGRDAEAFGGGEKVWHLPALIFPGYHPDVCSLFSSGKVLAGPLGNCHSVIAFTAFTLGLSSADTIGMFRKAVYAALGYLDGWDAARAELVGGFARHGFDIGRPFVKWSRHGPFMYMYLHPKIHCLHDLARLILARAGLTASDATALPHDNLANGQIFPVYPEIASRLGVTGSYLFKPPGEYRVIGLEEFVEASFEAYRGHASITTLPQSEAMLEHALSVIGTTR